MTTNSLPATSHIAGKTHTPLWFTLTDPTELDLLTALIAHQQANENMVAEDNPDHLPFVVVPDPPQEDGHTLPTHPTWTSWGYQLEVGRPTAIINHAGRYDTPEEIQDEYVLHATYVDHTNYCQSLPGGPVTFHRADIVATLYDVEPHGFGSLSIFAKELLPSVAHDPEINCPSKWIFAMEDV